MFQDLRVCVHFTCTNHPLNAYVGGVYLFGELLHSLRGVFIRVWVHVGLDPREWDFKRRNTAYRMHYCSVMVMISEHETTDNPHRAPVQQRIEDKIQATGLMQTALTLIFICNFSPGAWRHWRLFSLKQWVPLEGKVHPKILMVLIFSDIHPSCWNHLLQGFQIFFRITRTTLRSSCDTQNTKHVPFFWTTHCKNCKNFLN